MIDNKTSLDDLLKEAILSTRNVKKDEIYTVKDLFRGFEWNRISKGNRTKLGALYYAYSKNKGKSQISPGNKTPQNSQQYEKIK